MPDENEMQMNMGDKKRLAKAGKFLTEKDFAMYEEVSEISEHLEGIHEGVKMISEMKMPEMPKMEMPEVHRVSIEGAEIITIKGEKGEKGEAGDIGEKGEQGERGLDGKNGRDGLDGKDGVDGKNGENGKDGKDGSPDTPYQVRDKLESIDNESEKLKIDAIQDLKKELDDLKKKWSSRPIFGGGGFSVGALNFHIVDDETPTGAINDVNKDFIIGHAPSPVSSLKVFLNGQRMRITEDYTFSGTTISFTNAPLTGSILLVDYRI